MGDVKGYDDIDDVNGCEDIGDVNVCDVKGDVTWDTGPVYESNINLVPVPSAGKL